MYTLSRFMLMCWMLVWTTTYVATASVFPIAWLVPPVVAVTALRRQRGSTAHGSARWAVPKDVPHMLDGPGIVLGHLQGRVSKLWALRSLLHPHVPAKLACQRFFQALGLRTPPVVVRLTKSVHVAAFAPTGVGKGVSLVIPTLLTCVESMVVADFKGELVRETARVRRAMGHRVVVIDPHHVTTSDPDAFNPLEYLDRDSPTAMDDCRDLAEMLVVRTGQEKEPHWSDSAEIWIAAMIAIVVCVASKTDRSLQTVRTLLTDPTKMQAAIDYMCRSDAMDGMLARLGYQLTHFKDKELASTLTTTNRFLRFLDTPAIARCTGASTFDPGDLLRTKMTVYLVLPPDRMHAQSGLLRMWIGSLLRAVVKGGLQLDKRVHFVLDEAASLGQMQAIDDALDKYRGYGVRLLLLYQSLGQLRKCFPEGQDQTLLSNVTQVFFGVNDQQTADYVSARLGDATIVTQSGGTSVGTSTQHGGQIEHTTTSHTTNHNWQYMGRRLLKPEEVTALPERVAITFAPGVPPIATRLVRYYERDFELINGAGPWMTTFRAACLLVMACLLAVMIGAALTSHSLVNPQRTERNTEHVQTHSPVLRGSQNRQVSEPGRTHCGGGVGR